MSSLQGFCLVAPPGLCDDNFFRTVVLVIEHDDEGAVGVILNRPTSDPVDDVMRLLDDDAVDLERPTSELISINWFRERFNCLNSFRPDSGRTSVSRLP